MSETAAATAPATERGWTLQGLLQVVTASGVAATVLGFGAIYLQFQRHGVPMSLLTFEQAARAGLLPTAGLIATLAYALVAIRFRTMSALTVLPVFMPFVGILLVMSLVMLLGYVAGLAWFLDATVALVLKAVGLPLEDRPRLAIATTCIVGLLAAVGIASQRNLRRMRNRALDTTAPASEVGTTAATPARNGDEHSSKAQSSDLHWWQAPVGAFGVGVSLVAGLFGLRWYLSVFGLEWVLLGGLSDKSILLFGGLSALMFVIFVGMVFLIERDLEGTMGWIGAGLAAIGFLAFLVLYSTRLYPLLSPALGGGRTERVTLWIDNDDLPPDMRSRLPDGACITYEKLVRCDDLMLVPAGEKVLVVALLGAPALVLQRDAVKALALRSSR